MFLGFEHRTVYVTLSTTPLSPRCIADAPATPTMHVSRDYIIQVGVASSVKFAHQPLPKTSITMDDDRSTSAAKPAIGFQPWRNCSLRVRPRTMTMAALLRVGGRTRCTQTRVVRTARVAPLSLSSRMSTLYTFWDTLLAYRTESVHFSGAHELSN